MKPPPQDWEQRPHSPQSLTSQSTEGKLRFLEIISRRPTNLGRKHPCCTYLCLSCPRGKGLRHAKPLEELSVFLFLCRFHRFWCSRSTQTTSTYNQLVALHWITNLTRRLFTWAGIFGTGSVFGESRTFCSLVEWSHGYISISGLCSGSASDRAFGPGTVLRYLTVNWVRDVRFEILHDIFPPGHGPLEHGLVSNRGGHSAPWFCWATVTLTFLVSVPVSQVTEQSLQAPYCTSQSTELKRQINVIMNGFY